METETLLCIIIPAIAVPTFFTFIAMLLCELPDGWVGNVAMAATWPLWIVPLGLVAAYKQVSKAMVSIVTDEKR